MILVYEDYLIFSGCNGHDGNDGETSDERGCICYHRYV